MSSAYKGVKEVRGQVPGTTRNGGRTKSAINNFQASGYVRVPERVAQCLGLQRHRTETSKYPTEAPRYRSTAPVAGATLPRHLSFGDIVGGTISMIVIGVPSIGAWGGPAPPPQFFLKTCRQAPPPQFFEK